MEYRINKIDPDLRQKINEERNEEKIHNKKGINVNKDKDSTKEKMEQKNSKVDNTTRETDIDELGNKETEVQEPFKGHNIDIRR